MSERSESKPEAPSPTPRPDLGPVPPARLLWLGVFATLKAVGLVLVAEAVARGVVGVQAGELDARAVVILGASGALLRALAGWATQVAAQRVAIAVKRDLRARLWRRIAAGDAAGGAEKQGGVVVLASEGLDDLDDYYTQSLPAMIAAVAIPLVVGLRILGADGVSALIVVLTVPLVPVFMILIGRHTQERTDEATGALTRLADHLTELARGLPVLVGLGRVQEQTRSLDRIQREYRERTLATLRTAFLSALALELIATLSVAVVAVFLGLRLLYDTVPLEPALLALILAPEIYAALRDVGTAFHASQNGLSALTRVKALLARPIARDARGAVVGATPRLLNEVSEANEDEATTATPAHRPGARNPSRPIDERPMLRWSLHLRGLRPLRSATDRCSPPVAERKRPPEPIRITDLTIRYAGRAAPVVEGLGAELRGIVAVTGPSGAGKSTLLAALTGSLPADAEVTGAIRGADPSAVAWSPQAPRPFAATPREELALYGAADPLAALAELGLERVADAAVAELSPGEQRRLAVARALARVDAGASLLVLDEPTAHLDAVSADRVRAAVRRRAARATVVLATHEPETLALATSTVAVGSSEAAPAPAPRQRIEDPGPPREAPGLDSSLRSSLGPSRLRAPRSARRADVRAATPARLLASVIRPARWRWLGAIVLGVVATGMGLSLTAISGWLIVRASEEQYIMYLLVAIVGVRFFGIGRSVGRYAERLATHDAAFRVIDALRLRLWGAIAARGAGSRRLLEGGSPVDHLVTQADELRDQLPRTLAPIAVGVLSILGIAATTWVVAPTLALPVAGTLLLAAGLGSALAVIAARGAGAAGVRERAAVVRGTAALADAADDLRGNGEAPVRAALTRLDATAERLARAERSATWGAGLGAAVAVLATSLLAALVAVLAPGLLAQDLAVVALLSLAALEPLDGLVRAVHRLPALRAALARLALVLRPIPPALTGDREPADPVRHIELDGVSARYPGAAAPAFAGVDGAARAGEWLVLAGPSGSGKSTLLSVLMGALPAAAGEVRADGVPLPRLDAAAWRRRVAWCPQEAYVFDSTLRGNLLLARDRADAPSDADMRRALERAGLGALLDALPEGFDTRVGAGGSALSGGERQRLAVARVLLSRAGILLLDEPTAHLDAPTAAAMMDDIRAASADRITVLVSHRPADMRAGDRVIRLGAVRAATAAAATSRRERSE
ncbi:thiol reductant ABC exporter subunit CydC [Microbacterium sp. NPDC003461]